MFHFEIELHLKASLRVQNIFNDELQFEHGRSVSKSGTTLRAGAISSTITSAMTSSERGHFVFGVCNFHVSPVVVGPGSCFVNVLNTVVVLTSSLLALGSRKCASHVGF